MCCRTDFVNRKEHSAHPDRQPEYFYLRLDRCDTHPPKEFIMQNSTDIKLELKKYPKMIELFAKENFNLKYVLFFLLVILMTNYLTTVYLLKRGT